MSEIKHGEPSPEEGRGEKSTRPETTVNEAVGAVATELTKFFHMSQRPVPEDPSRYNGGIGHQTDYGV